MPLQTLAQAIFDAVLVHIVNSVSPGGKWQRLQQQMCESLNRRKVSSQAACSRKAAAKQHSQAAQPCSSKAAAKQPPPSLTPILPPTLVSGRAGPFHIEQRVRGRDDCLPAGERHRVRGQG